MTTRTPHAKIRARVEELGGTLIRQDLWATGGGWDGVVFWRRTDDDYVTHRITWNGEALIHGHYGLTFEEATEDYRERLAAIRPRY